MGAVTTYPRECVDIGSLMAASQPPLVAFSIGSNVLFMAQTQFFDGLLDHINTTIVSHWFGAEASQKQTQNDFRWYILKLLHNRTNKTNSRRQKKTRPVIGVSTSTIPIALVDNRTICQLNVCTQGQHRSSCLLILVEHEPELALGRRWERLLQFLWSSVSPQIKVIILKEISSE